MKTASLSLQIEPLESRIAPATILAGKHGTAGTTNYDTAVSPNVSPLFHLAGVAPGAGADEVNTTAVGGNADTYYIKLKVGDDLQIFDGKFSSEITVKSGVVVAFFVDANHDKNVDPGEISGVSLGNG